MAMGRFAVAILFDNRSGTSTIPGLSVLWSNETAPMMSVAVTSATSIWWNWDCTIRSARGYWRGFLTNEFGRHHLQVRVPSHRGNGTMMTRCENLLRGIPSAVLGGCLVAAYATNA